MAKRTCIEVDCGGVVFARSACQMHYMRALRSGAIDMYPLARKPHEVDPARPTRCAHCGDEFESRRRSRANGGAWIRCCSKSCARRLAMAEGTHQFQTASRYGTWTAGGDAERERDRGERSRRRRRARLADAASEPYTTVEIADRDGGRCGVCRRKVRLDLEWPHPRSASVDHIVPLSRGGDDTKSNVRLAHLRCNISQGNRVEWGQQLLIG